MNAPHQRLTIFRRDGVTPILGSVDGAGRVVEASFSTEPTHPRPHLEHQPEGPDSRVMLAEGRAVIGQVTLTVLDNPPAGSSDQDAGVFTSILAREGESALARARARWEQWDGSRWVVLQDGPIGAVQQTEDKVGYTLTVLDARDGLVEVPLFTRAATATVLPTGVLNGYGWTGKVRAPSGPWNELPNPSASDPADWLIPPTVPLKARFVHNGGTRGDYFFDLDGLWSGGSAPDALIVTELLDEIFGTTILFDPDRYGLPPLPSSPSDVPRTYVQYPRIHLGWRLPGQTAWNWLRDPFGISSTNGRHLLVKESKKHRDADRKHALYQINLTSGLVEQGGAYSIAHVRDLVPHNTVVELVLGYLGVPTEAYPFHWEGPAWQLLKEVYDGLHSDGQGVTRYNLEALQRLNTPLRLRITEPVQDGRKWLEEQVYRPLGAAPALDDELRIAPVVYELPDIDAPLLELNDANVEDATWLHSGADIVNVAAVTYQRDYRAAPGEKVAGDGVASRKVTVRHKSAPSITALGREASNEIEAETLRAIGGTIGEPVTGDVSDETGARLAARRNRMLVDRYRYGGQHFEAIYLGDAPVRAGDWALVGISWLPDYQTGRRGTSRLAQVVSVAQLDPIARRLVLEDAGPDAQPCPQPALGAVSVDADGVVSVPVTSIPAGVEAAVYYAISETRPDVGGGAWLLAGRIAEPGTVCTPPAPAGSVVWISARGEAEGRRPSAWTNATSVVVPQTPRIRDLRILIAEDGSAVVTWTANAYALGLKLRHALHAADAEPGSWTLLELPAASGRAELAGIIVAAGQAITVEATPTSAWSGSAATSTEGVPVRRTGVRPAGPEQGPKGDKGDTGAPGAPGASAEVRYSGPGAGQNISATFDPAKHLYMQARRSDQSWPTEWVRIVGEKGATGEASEYTDYIFRCSSTEPPTPVGVDPWQWSDAPGTCVPPAVGWMSLARKRPQERLPLDNPTESGALGGWNASGLRIATAPRDGVNLRTMALTTSDSVQIYSPYIDIDPTRSYEVRLSFYAEDAFAGNNSNGRILLGINAQDASGLAINVEQFSVTTRTFGVPTGNPYFRGGTEFAKGAWMDVVAYLVGSAVGENEVPQGKNVHNHIRLPANARRVRLRWLNFDNNGTARTAHVWNPTLRPVDEMLESWSRPVRLTGADGPKGDKGDPGSDAPALPYLEAVRVLSTGVGKASVYGRVRDPRGAGGSLRVWIGADANTEANPTAAHEASVAVPAASSWDFGPTTSFTPTPARRLENIAYNSALPKRIFLEYVDSGGRSSGVQAVPLTTRLDQVIDEQGALKAQAIRDAAAASTDVTVILRSATVPSTYAGSQVLLVGNEIYRWTGTKYVRDVATEALVGTIGENLLANAAVTVNKIKDASVTGPKIAVGAVDTEHLRVGSPSLPLGNPTVSGKLDGWIATGLRMATAPRGGVNVPTMALTSSSNTTVQSQPVDVDPTRSYELRLSLYAEDAYAGTTTNGRVLVGIQAIDANNAAIAAESFVLSTRLFTAPNTTPYFHATSGAPTAMAAGEWRDIVAYVIGAGVSPEEVPQGKNVTNAIRLPANTRTIRVRWLNFNGDGASRTLHVWSPTLTPVDATIIHGSGIVTGTVALNTLAFLAAERDKIVAAINATSEGVRIQGNRITVDGTVSFGSGYNPTEKETPSGAQAKATAAENAAKAASLARATYLTPGKTTIDGGLITAESIRALALNADVVQSLVTATEFLSAVNAEIAQAVIGRLVSKAGTDGIAFTNLAGNTTYGGIVADSASQGFRLFAGSSAAKLSPSGLDITGNVQVNGQVDTGSYTGDAPSVYLPQFGRVTTEIVTLKSNVAIYMPTAASGVAVGRTVNLLVRQDAVGGRTLTWNNVVGGVAIPAPDTGPQRVSVYRAICMGSEWIVERTSAGWLPSGLGPGRGPGSVSGVDTSYCIGSVAVYEMSVTITGYDATAHHEVYVGGALYITLPPGTASIGVSLDSPGTKSVRVRAVKDGLAHATEATTSVSVKPRACI